MSEKAPSKFKKVSGLYKNKSGNGYSGKTRDAVTIPAGSRVFVFDRRPSDKDDPAKSYPEVEVLFTLPDDQGYGGGGGNDPF